MPLPPPNMRYSAEEISGKSNPNGRLITGERTPRRISLDGCTQIAPKYRMATFFGGREHEGQISIPDSLQFDCGSGGTRLSHGDSTAVGSVRPNELLLERRQRFMEPHQWLMVSHVSGRGQSCWVNSNTSIADIGYLGTGGTTSTPAVINLTTPIIANSLVFGVPSVTPPAVALLFSQRQQHHDRQRDQRRRDHQRRGNHDGHHDGTTAYNFINSNLTVAGEPGVGAWRSRHVRHGDDLHQQLHTISPAPTPSAA